ncbi:unnamed protein product [Spirodela intermedia]|uniref:Uncharacterized protein n=1 Tax=Spirodela intermedia TaxID=51605 RepID=A0A7I8JS45_SPIIN|nr:unnamed protein product [Spirodela intermedia]CAA6672581.1 unnamed protein product [Spirodela intermedia]
MTNNLFCYSKVNNQWKIIHLEIMVTRNINFKSTISCIMHKS